MVVTEFITECEGYVSRPLLVTSLTASLFYSFVHCTLPITLEKGKINNHLLHFPSSLFTENVLQKTQEMAFPRP